jgi:Uma2 family endonuclease
MATNPLNPAYLKVEVHKFLQMDFGDAKAELVDGTIFMMAGGSPRHAAIAANLIFALMTKLKGSGYRAYGSDLAAQTGPNSVRFPDVSVYCGEANHPKDPKAKLIGDPEIIFEVLSPSTASNDQLTKLAEYRALPGVKLVVFVDPDNERVRSVDTAQDGESDWQPTGSELKLASLGINLSHEDVFAA